MAEGREAPMALSELSRERSDPVELAVVIPTYNERDNVAELLGRLTQVLAGVAWEAIYVDDDSPDGTAHAVREIAQSDRRVRIIQRVGRKGLSTAVIEGMLATAAPYIAVIDADLQHDEHILPVMLAEARNGADVVVGSRYVDGGGVGDWSKTRAEASALATRIANAFTPANVSDPMSGFFLLRRDVLLERVHNLSGMGFKILLDILATPGASLVVKEVPYQFRSRTAGESKLDNAVLVDFALMLLDKRVGRYIPARFILFAAVGGFGVLVHLGVLWAAVLAGGAFVTSQIAATLVAMTSNYFLNNTFTFRERRRKGFRIVTGLLSFYLVCSIGAVANVGIAQLIYQNQVSWIISGLAGVAVGSVWNYAVSSVYTWSR